MSSDQRPVAIRAHALAKCYHLYERPVHRLLQLLSRERRRYYREFWALRDASFEVARGEVLGIVGRNGAGKSTLLQLVCQTLAPSAGSVTVTGRVAALLELGAGFNPDFTGRENVRLSASILGLSRAEIDARFEDIVDFSGIRDYIDQPVKFYSSGMYVRLAFAVATSVDPDVLVIDEALSVGDGEFARKSFDRIMALKKAGVTILFCSHSLYQVEAFCDRVLWLDHGRPMALGDPREVVQRYSEAMLASAPSAIAETRGETAAQPSGPAIAGYARLTHIETELDGQPGHELTARPGKNTLTVKVEFESDPALPAPALGVTLDYGSLLAVTCAVSRSDGIVMERDAAGRGFVTLTFPQLALRKGAYRVGVYLACENALHLYDHVQHVASISVEDAVPDPGVVTLPHTWHSSPGAASAPAAAGRTGWHRAVLTDGRALWVDSRDSLGLAASGVFEPAETALCRRLLRPGNRVLDIGANLGYYTTLFAECVGAAGRVDAFEPDPHSFALLDANTRAQQGTGCVKVHALALSDATGSARLYLSKDNTGMHRLYESVCSDGTTVEVPMARGDELELAPLDFIKIDVEGYEPRVLQGLAATLAHSPNVKILCEYSPLAMLEAGSDPRQWLQWMQEQGFNALAEDRGEWKATPYANLLEQAECLTRFDMTAFRARVRDADNAAIAAAAQAQASAHGYRRPILENLLFLRPGSDALNGT